MKLIYKLLILSLFLIPLLLILNMYFFNHQYFLFCILLISLLFPFLFLKKRFNQTLYRFFALLISILFLVFPVLWLNGISLFLLQNNVNFEMVLGMSIFTFFSTGLLLGYYTLFRKFLIAK